MPHTNRARRADHYRSIETNSTSTSTSTSTSKSNGNQGGRRRSHQDQDGDALNHKTDGEDGHPQRYGGRSAGRGSGGRGAGRDRQGGTHGRGGGRGAEARAAAAPAAGAKGKSKTPSVKNRIRSLTRLMNKPVKAWCFDSAPTCGRDAAVLLRCVILLPPMTIHELKQPPLPVCARLPLGLPLVTWCNSSLLSLEPYGKL